MIAHNEININADTAYLIESLKVEGYWSTELFTLTIQNKNIPFLNHIEEILNKINIVPAKRILLKIRLNDNSKKDEIEIKSNENNLNFHVEKSPFNPDKVKAVISIPYKKFQTLIFKYKNEEYSIKISYKKDKIECNANLECWVYGDLRFPIKRLLDFLDKNANKKSLEIGKYLIEKNEELIASAFSALIDCEGSINYYGLKRTIRVRMRNKQYLWQWSKLLNKIGIGCTFRKNSDKEYEINISGWEDFSKLSKIGIKFYNSKKENEWRKMMMSFKRNQISRNSYKEFYINKLKEINREVTSQEFAEYLKKGKRVASHYLLKLEKKGLISCNKKIWPYRYFISTSSVR
ncbi:MAG: LAGLIDADG family homing endonuclease [Candidatus Pacearchaeota archaeon]|jgi:hypothetical protein